MVNADELRFGFPVFPSNLDILNSDHPAAQFLRTALTAGLTRREPLSSGRSYMLRFADDLRVSADYSMWSFHLIKKASFSNGRQILAEDVKYSVERCKRSGMFGTLIKAVPRSVKRFYDEPAEWVDFYFPPGVMEASPPDAFPLELAECPLLDSRLGEVFGQEFGLGVNLVSAGEYVFSGFKPARSFELVRSKRRDLAGPDTLELRAFLSMRQALTALRSGTVDGFFTQDGEILGLAAEDETLRVNSCLDWQLVSRSGLKVECSPALDLRQLRYETW